MVIGSFSFALGCLLVWWIAYKLDPSDEKLAEMREEEKVKDDRDFLNATKKYLDKYGPPPPNPNTATNEEIITYIATIRKIDIELVYSYYDYCRLLGIELDPDL